MRFVAVLAACASALSVCSAQGGSMGAESPFSAPAATVHYAPDRQFDLRHLALELVVDYPNRAASGRATNSIVLLRDGISDLRFNAGQDVRIDAVTVNGRAAAFTHAAEDLVIKVLPLKAGEKADVAIAFHFKKNAANNRGFHWLEPTKAEPQKIGFWTNGETSQARDWCPTWDYPNDFTTTETKTTVPADWTVIGNGLKVSDKLSANHKTRTVEWRLDIPHATYLLSILAGPLDVKRDKWRGIDLIYAVPRGKGSMIDYSFEDTKDMLSFYSDRLGYKYPWPKYAQDCTFDFGGGQENVSATTLGQNFLTDRRQAIHGMDWLNSHEMGHQWFGDTVTCKDWGQIWLNESFATYMQESYFEHSRGLYAYQRELETNSQTYFVESHRYKRPLVTNFYSQPGVMFDEHTYPKGGVLLHSLRRFLGDEPFYAGLHRYLWHHEHSPVETSQLMEEMSDASGINLAAWFKQWIYEPGHPVIDWSWTWDEAHKQVVVHVKQTQDIKDGTPIYDIPAHVGLIHGGIDRRAIQLNAADQEFRLPATAKPDAVVFDPDHDFLREIPTQPWAASELPAVLRYAPNCIDRTYAMTKLLEGTPSDAAVHDVVDAFRADQGPFPAFVDVQRIEVLDRPWMRPFFEGELHHASYERRTAAVVALGRLKIAEVNRELKRMVSDEQPYSVVSAALTALGANDYAANVALFRHQARSTNSGIRGAALSLLLAHNDPGALDIVFQSTLPGQPSGVREAGYQALSAYSGNDPRLVTAIRNAFQELDFQINQTALNIAVSRKMKEVLPDIDRFIKANPFIAGFVKPMRDKIAAP